MPALYVNELRARKASHCKGREGKAKEGGPHSAHGIDAKRSPFEGISVPAVTFSLPIAPLWCGCASESTGELHEKIRLESFPERGIFRRGTFGGDIRSCFDGGVADSYSGFRRWFCGRGKPEPTRTYRTETGRPVRSAAFK